MWSPRSAAEVRRRPPVHPLQLSLVRNDATIGWRLGLQIQGAHAAVLLPEHSGFWNTASDGTALAESALF